MLSIVACSFLFKTGDGDHRAPCGAGKARESRDRGRWRRGDPPPRLGGRRHDARQAVPDVPNQGNRRGRPTPAMHTTHATASWRRAEQGGQQTLVAPFRDEHRTRPLTNLLPELRPGLLPESWASYQPLTNLLPEPLTWPLRVFQSITLSNHGALTSGGQPDYCSLCTLTDPLPGAWPLTRLLPGTLSQRGLLLEAWALLLPTSYLGAGLLPTSYQPLT